MSRLIVKNLPAKVSEDDIKKHFSQKGNVTDIKLVYKDGEFRRYGFVGFEKEQDAKVACKYFNNTFIKQAKIAVEVCKEFKDGNKPVSWREKNKLRKKAAKDALNNNESKEESEDVSEKKSKKKNYKETNKSSSEDLLKQYENDPDFKDFLKSTSNNLEEDPATSVLSTSQVEEEQSEDEDDEKSDQEEDDVKIAEKKEVSDLDYLKSLKVSKESDGSTSSVKKKTPIILKEHFCVVIRTKERCKIRQNGSMGFTKQSVKDFLKPLKCKSLRIPPKTKFVAYVGFKTEREMRKALQKHKSFLNGARVQVKKYEKRVEEEESSAGKNAPWQMAEEKLKKTEPAAETGKLFVRNLWYSVTEDDLRELFEKFGKVTDITLPICKITRRPKGFGTITYMFPEHSVLAMTKLDGTSFKGRILHILPARCDENENEEKEGESFKDKKAREQKATAGSWHNWNTLFLGSGAVIDIMAEKYNRSKREILNSEGKQSVAVNLALGESQIVDETKRFLEENGISLEAFTTPGVQRSNTVILVKNLPANTTAQELSQIFSRYGELGRVVLPPAGVTGIVEYLDPGEAKKGFRSLAYSKFHYLPLYLEWAPQKIFRSDATQKSKTSKDVKPEAHNGRETNTEQKTQELVKQEENNSKKLPAPEPNTTVYVKNLNFSTTEKLLKKHFSSVGQVHSVLIAKRRELSQGYGFVQFVKQSDAQKALRELQDSVLEEKNLEVKLSEKTLAAPVKSARMLHDAGEQNSSKILVKNIPFEATRREVRQLFSTFGELKSVRLPNKPATQDHRGFGFIDFVSKEEAKKAFEALCQSTHLYGRRLVLEWAKDDETVEELREKTAQQFLSGGPPLKKKKFAETLEINMEVGEDD
ncbi:LOW QUALITY PROTEIN: probable RNA-binding protein 19 [Palaemon carinicauda]|uniref:LOW QUALITY PROTEIN: probable RNA-binding protein 19 n=1 Tax=Palaemon carinicauda TaxID=392227 RepID=UPI0035B630C5